MDCGHWTGYQTEQNKQFGFVLVFFLKHIFVVVFFFFIPFFLCIDN